MHQDPLEQLFRKNKGEFDLQSTPQGHQSRFMERLNAANQQEIKESKSRVKSLYRPLMAIAAVGLLALLVTGVFNSGNDQNQGLASVSPEMAQTQEFFTLAINEQITKLESFDSEVSKDLVQDTLEQLGNLETQYEQLSQDLIESGNDKRVINALIANLQSRIDLLEQMTITIEEIELINQTETDETSINTL